MDSNIMINDLMNEEDKNTNFESNNSKSYEKKKLNKIKIFLSNNKNKERKTLPKQNSNPFKFNIFEKKSEWKDSKKDSEKTIVNNDEYHVLKSKRNSSSLSFSEYSEKINPPETLKEHSSKNNTTTKNEQINHNEGIINENVDKTFSTSKNEPFINSKSQINEENYKNRLTEKIENSCETLDGTYEIIDNSPALSEKASNKIQKRISYYDSNDNSNEIFTNRNIKNSQLIECQDNSAVTLNDDSINYDNIFNYNSDIILSDDEDIRKSKVDELYNEAVIINNLDDNMFSYINDESYNEYVDNSIDNSGSSDNSLPERSAGINNNILINNPNNLNMMNSSDFPEINNHSVNENNNKNYNLAKIINNDIKCFENFPLKPIDSYGIKEIEDNKIQSNFVNPNDDIIYIVDDYDDEDDEIQSSDDNDDDNYLTQNKKRVTFNEDVKIEKIDRIETQERKAFKNYIKGEFKSRFKKLKKIFSKGSKMKKYNSVISNYQNEIPVIMIEYVDDYYDSYNKKEVIYFDKDCPKIVIDFVDDYDDIEQNDEDINNLSEIVESNDKNIINIKDNNNIKMNDNDNNENIKVIEPVNSFIPNDSNNIENTNINLGKEEESIPFYLREAIPKINKKKQKKAKKFIDELMNFEKNYEEEINSNKIKHENDNNKNTIITNESNDLELLQKDINHESKNESNAAISESITDTKNSTLLPKHKFSLKNKSKSMNYLKNIYKNFKRTISLNDFSKDNTGEIDENSNTNTLDSNLNSENKSYDNNQKSLKNDNDDNNDDSLKKMELKDNVKIIENTNDDINVNNILINNNNDKKNNNFKNCFNGNFEVENSKDFKDLDGNFEKKLETLQSSLETVVVDVDNIEISNSNVNVFEEIELNNKADSKNEDASIQEKKGWSLSKLFKKTKQHKKNNDNNSNNNDVVVDIDNNKIINDQIDLKSLNSNSIYNPNLNITSDQKEIENKLSNSSDEYQKEIKNDYITNLDKMDSSLTETDILAKQISRISSSLEENINVQTLNNSTFSIDEDIRIKIPSDNEIISNEKQIYDYQEEYNDNNEKENNLDEYISTSFDLHYQQEGQSEIEMIENENVQHNKKVFSPVILPIDQENDFNKVETIEVIDEYIFNCSSPFVFYNKDGDEEEIYEIIIEDEIRE